MSEIDNKLLCDIIQLQSKYGYSNKFIAQMINKDVEFINELLNPVESIY